MLKAVFFDLDGTLLPMDEKKFTEGYFKLLCNKVMQYGYEPKRLIDSIWAGTKRMYLNNGIKTNEEVFWDYFKEEYTEEKMKDKKYFDEFYINEFKKTKEYCNDNPYAKEIVNFCKENLDYVVLSTNPIFPLDGTKTRMAFVGLKEDDFDYVTSYENSSYTKPNPKYFLSLLEKFNLKPEEVILFGNNSLEDGDCASACGIKCFLVGDYVINDPKAKGVYPHVKMENIISTIKEEIDNRK